MSKKRVKFSEQLVTDVFEFEKDYPSEDNYGSSSSSVVKRSIPSCLEAIQEINEETRKEEHYAQLERDEFGDQNIDFKGCLLDNDTRNEHLDITKVSGQETSTITHDGDIQITPFNLKEEMAYGHFDSTGSFVFRREKNDIQDNWLDSVDWDRVKQPETSFVTASLSGGSIESAENEDDIVDAYEQISQLLDGKETILKAIIRYGKENTKSNLEKLTELADKLLINGEVNVYDFSKATIQLKLSKASSKRSTNEDDDLEDVFNGTAKSSTPLPPPNDDKDGGNIDQTVNLSDAPLWEYKWENTNEAPIYGPFTSEQMAEWKNNGFFQNKIYCRKVDVLNSITSQPDFHSSERIDFDLYL